jgi:hypothetical protein
MKTLPLPPLDAERTARTLASLTETIHKLRCIRCGTPENKTDDEQPDDDMPADIDAFRDALARRIEAFMESRTDAECGIEDDAAGSARSQP